MSQNLNRIACLDGLRALAIMLMVIYHFFFDLHYFGLYDTNLNESGSWRVFRYIILSLFLICVGISLALSHEKGIRWKAYWKRLAWLFGACVLVSAGSYTQFPNSWIYFGVLHFILFSSLVALPLVRWPNVALGLSVLILLAYNAGFMSTPSLFSMLHPYLHLPHRTEDLVPVFPWLALVFFGVYVGRYQLFNVPALSANTPHWAQKLSQRSLLIYLIHQPVLFMLIEGTLYLVA